MLTVTGLRGSEYFTALSMRLAIALTTWRSVARDQRAGDAGVRRCRLIPARVGRRPQLVDRVVDEHLERHRRRASAPPASR